MEVSPYFACFFAVSDLSTDSVPYAISDSYRRYRPANHFIRYRNMCRFQSRAFYKQELVLPYRWYWRVEYVLGDFWGGHL